MSPRFLFRLAVFLAPLPSLSAQSLDVRTRLAPNAPWIEATLHEAAGDSFDLRLKTGALTLRSTNGGLTVQRNSGFTRKQGAKVGALIGGGLSASMVLLGGSDALVEPVSWAIIGGYTVFGALLGAALTQPRWETLSLSSSCPAYRLAGGSLLTVRTASGRELSGRVVEHRRDSLALAVDTTAEATWIRSAGMSVRLPVRDRKKGALLWGAVGAAAFGALYLASPPDQRSGGLEGTFIVGQYAAIIGFIVGKKTTVYAPLPRC